MNTVTINNKQLPAVEYRGQRVVTFAMIDEVHNRPQDTARAAFNRNREHFIAGVDYEELGSDVIRTDLPEGTFSKFAPSGIVIFESGYLMLTKPFNDPLSWQVQRELINSYFRIRAPLTEIEMIAAMAADAVRQQKRLNQVEVRIETVTEAVENIKRGNMRAGYVGYRQVVAKSGMTDAKCRNLVNAYRIPTDTHEFMTPDGLLSRRAIVELEPFMEAFHQMMSEAEPRGTRWYHPKMGLFQAIGWEGKA
ncbi:ORF6N domain-containing protein [Salmonella enterica subsp. enterica serovar Pomona]|uniref:ORF6N domain-containing protein n=1 Tax=Salmonella enterica TaxID=28901 RepID=UPI000FB11A6E|nr:ORF6N domain-containing protein [Salmonella enterica]EED3950795.1 ORF6N domain-containing protein [Salmonella enterica subsp. enterica serovar Newport]EBV7993859.1 ORF6N domain-containing protein [Salmonella enterica subsp. enterica serovar Pomona]EBV8075384.1 ORF6N domain-containing protein [Salmonella enterica subsp. enterica serovar Pomona]EBZ1619034.1 ORF6N domain-containing protein [Salmonella enterica subsp. enterica serovar Pomona]EDP9278653.1 ORF6N domain-containing protein [Salmone